MGQFVDVDVWVYRLRVIAAITMCAVNWTLMETAPLFEKFPTLTMPSVEKSNVVVFGGLTTVVLLGMGAIVLLNSRGAQRVGKKKAKQKLKDVRVVSDTVQQLDVSGFRAKTAASN